MLEWFPFRLFIKLFLELDFASRDVEGPESVVLLEILQFVLACIVKIHIMETDESVKLESVIIIILVLSFFEDHPLASQPIEHFKFFEFDSFGS